MPSVSVESTPNTFCQKTLVISSYLDIKPPRRAFFFVRVNMGRFLFLTLPIALLLSLETVLGFPAHGSLAGLSQRQLADILPTLVPRALESPPGPLNDTSAKIGPDPAHPWIAPGPNDIRGPCPGLNTLASHGVSIDRIAGSVLFD